MIPSSTAFTSGSSAPSRWMWNSFVSSRCEGWRLGNQEAHRPILSGVLKMLLKILCSDAWSSWSPAHSNIWYYIPFQLYWHMSSSFIIQKTMNTTKLWHAHTNTHQGWEGLCTPTTSLQAVLRIWNYHLIECDCWTSPPSPSQGPLAPSGSGGQVWQATAGTPPPANKPSVRLWRTQTE